MGPIAVVARALHAMLLALWLGSATTFMMLAPTLLQKVPSRHDADQVMIALLEKLGLRGLLAGPLVLVTLLVGWGSEQVPLRLRAGLALALTLGAGLAGRWIAPNMTSLALAMGRRIEDLAPSEPLVLEFLRFEAWAEWAALAQACLAAVLLVLVVAGGRSRRRAGIEL